MADVNNVVEALKFMVLGMGVVYLFLYILVVLVKVQASLIAKYFPENIPKIPTPPVGQTIDEDENRRVAAIIAAVSEFRKK
ncbi:MAG: Na+-transporting oxaloacetate decarboxylase subunit gamma [Sulfurovum sp. FS06-10]|jgi:oxaloacetate decarboxylase gamma subunit|nr:MAG: Na+-transporting oxaloacetate decarboxylase subunit gamma [Sulfurovum sp. FS06-10]